MARAGEAVSPQARLNGACKFRQGNEEEEHGMYGLADYEVWRRRPREIRQEVTVARLERKLRANRGGGFRPVQDLKWGLARYAGLLGKRLRSAS